MKNQFYHENLSRQVQIVGQMRGGHRRNILESDADASRLRKGLSLPSRRLVPCILAALTAGTVTLGALPCAYADPIVRSSVTEDIDAPDGVAGSIDGSAATITIGTEGGGTSPEIKHGSGFTAVYGSRYRGAAPSFTLQGGRAVIRSGRMRQLYGGNARVQTTGGADASVQVTGSSVTSTGGRITDVFGGYASAQSDSGNAYAAARGNVVHLQGGVYQTVHGGMAETRTNAGRTTAIAEGNTVYISGGTYPGSGYIVAGWAKRTGAGSAIARNNTIEITGAPGPLPALSGGRVSDPSDISENNALIVRRTKGITAISVEFFQRFVFYAPADLAAGEAMLSLSALAPDVELKGAAVEAYLPGSSTAHELTLLQAGIGDIKTDAATKMTVYEGISGTLANAMYVDSTGKKLLVRRDGAFQFTGGDNAKSLAETMAGAAAFLGTGAHLFTDGGLASASAEAASASGFAPFAAMGGSSLRHETGSHVEMTGMNLAVGFSREVLRGDERVLFGPIVEYGRGTYDSYVNDAHGDGSVRYVGVGGFIRQEQADGTFYEGSLRFGRSSMDYSAVLSGTPTSYDTDTNYIGAHLGFGQRVTEQSGSERELYVRYFYTRQNGTDATLSTGERYEFDAVDSHRLRTGARWMIPQGSGSLILGASMQYEFGGDSSATVYGRGFTHTTPSPSLKGFSGSLELGWKAPMGKNATADLSIEGWAGKQRGVTFNAGFNWKF